MQKLYVYNEYEYRNLKDDSWTLCRTFLRRKEKSECHMVKAEAGLWEVCVHVRDNKRERKQTEAGMISSTSSARRCVLLRSSGALQHSWGGERVRDKDNRQREGAGGVSEAWDRCQFTPPLLLPAERALLHFLRATQRTRWFTSAKVNVEWALNGPADTQRHWERHRWRFISTHLLSNVLTFTGHKWEWIIFTPLNCAYLSWFHSCITIVSFVHEWMCLLVALVELTPATAA